MAKGKTLIQGRERMELTADLRFGFDAGDLCTGGEFL